MRAFPESRPLIWKSEVLLHIERSRKWINWKHIKVLLAIVRCRTAVLGGHLDEHALRTSRHLLQFRPPYTERKSLNQECGWKDGDRGGLARMQGIHGRERENRKSKQKKRKTHLTHSGLMEGVDTCIFIGFMNKLWRRGWDSNPR